MYDAWDFKDVGPLEMKFRTTEYVSWPKFGKNVPRNELEAKHTIIWYTVNNMTLLKKKIYNLIPGG